ncbi:hypothetical protein ACYCII_23630, partial [Enterobacter roggenkampii]|uniref:hypothetical protein n=1 Tax=Enterobacter roggenkampii TaxID=1812935 RepID=UPI003D6EE8C1
NRLIRCVCGKKIGPDPRNFNQRVSLGRNDLLIRTFPSVKAHSISSQINIKCQFATRAAFYDRFSGDDSARFTQASGKRSGYRVSCQRKRKKRLNIHRPKRVCNKIIQRVPFKIAEMLFKGQFKSQNE